ncbi:phosphotransferase [Erythrobacter sp. JK5]|uniref:phosphotransferase n=1 Tax=Erythrobacter sp. JK5 TaxID=2829500 RepID=UPI001BA9F30A|nr:phosphotransferase [Erythrobacter sp. JK5]QUL36938.1 phosphotransferase family protein [Erythrobacter sp. JK5]
MAATPEELNAGLTRAMERAGLGVPEGLHRLTGGATMESWRFSCANDGRRDEFVLRRAPSLAFMEDRPYGHDVEAAVIRAAKAAGVTAPEVVVELEPEDEIGSGFVMRALPGTPNPREILEFDGADALLGQAARDLARIHSIKRGDVPDAVPVMDYRAAIADLRQQFEEAGGDRPIIALGLKWMEDNCPDPAHPVLVHGDYRMGNLLAEPGRLTGVLDWELAHFGDRHEDLAFGCMAVWRFARYDRPALGLGSLEDYFAAYEAEAGVTVDRERFRYWLIHRTVWWALGCLKMAQHWRSGQDRMLERVVISRRTSEQELDLLMLLEEDAPLKLRRAQVGDSLTDQPFEPKGEATASEIAVAVSEWLASMKDQMKGHDRFQLAVARNALGIIERETSSAYLNRVADYPEDLSFAILSGSRDLSDKYLLSDLRFMALECVRTDSPKYPALAVARERWL